jgi:hypothetical protein
MTRNGPKGLFRGSFWASAKRSYFLPYIISPETGRSSLTSYAVVVANRTSKLMALTAASAMLVGTGALLDVSQASAAFSPSVPSERVFASRSAAPVRPADVPVPVELRPTSPMPYAGGALLDSPEPEAELSPRVAPPAPRERHELTSFDGSRTLSDSGTLEPSQALPAPHVFAPAPVVWNNPLRWIGVHQNNL